jgi:hypothetical protein
VVPGANAINELTLSARLGAARTQSKRAVTPGTHFLAVRRFGAANGPLSDFYAFQG